MYRFLLFLLCWLSLELIAPESVRAESPEKIGSVSVELLEAGSMPRREIRFIPKKGAKQTSVMTMTMSQSMTIDGKKLPSQNIPPQKITMEIGIDDVSSNGDIEFAFKYTDLDVVDDPNNPSPLAPVLRTTLKPLIGATGSGLVTNRGFTKRGEMKIPDDLAAPLKQSLDGMKDAMNRLSSPVPGEKIGMGAKWRVVQDINANGIQLKQTSIHELTRLDEKGFAMKVTLTQLAEPQEIKNPALPAGTKLSLVSLDTSGQGASTIAMDSIFPTESEITIESRTNMQVETPAGQQKMSTEMKLGMTLAGTK